MPRPKGRGFFILRQTFGQLTQTTRDASIDDTATTYTGLSDTETFLKREINNTVAYLFSLLRDYKLQPPPYIEPTISGNTYYNFRPGFSKLTSLTINVGTYVPPLKIVENEDEWNRLQQVPATGGWPTHVFPRRDTYGIYPKPQAVYSMTLTGIWIPVNMTNDDYTTGTIAITNASSAIVGTSTTFTASMVNRWLVPTNNSVPSSNIYRIASFTDATHIATDRNVIDTTASGLSYLIGESPEIPEELHEFIPYRAAATYYALRRRDMTSAANLMNYFYTGDYANTNRRGDIKGGVLAVLRDLKEKGRGNSQLVETGGTSSSVDIIRDASWTSVISKS